jgi:5-methylcytosine-specific restriction endonuclease McrA
MIKPCSVCNELKSGSMFSPDKRVPSGLSSRCKACNAADARNRRAQNPEKHRASVKKSTEKHYLKKLERNRQYRLNNPEKILDWKTKDRQRNKARILADNAGRRAKLKINLTPEIKQMYAMRDFMQAMSLGDCFHVDHIVPLSKGGLHTANNLQVIPAICNLRKGSRL